MEALLGSISEDLRGTVRASTVRPCDPRALIVSVRPLRGSFSASTRDMSFHSRAAEERQAKESTPAVEQTSGPKSSWASQAAAWVS